MRYQIKADNARYRRELLAARIFWGLLALGLFAGACMAWWAIYSWFWGG